MADYNPKADSNPAPSLKPYPAPDPAPILASGPAVTTNSPHLLNLVVLCFFVFCVFFKNAKKSRERDVWVTESELTPRALRLWVESRSLTKRSQELGEVRRREALRQRREDKKRGGSQGRRARF